MYEGIHPHVTEPLELGRTKMQLSVPCSTFQLAEANLAQLINIHHVLPSHWLKYREGFWEMACVPKLLTLPEDVLEIILKEYFRGQSLSIRDINYLKDPSYQSEPLPLSMSILLTCRQLHRMDVSILFSNVIFYHHDYHYFWAVMVNDPTVKTHFAGGLSKIRHVSGDLIVVDLILLELENDCSSHENLESVIMRDYGGRMVQASIGNQILSFEWLLLFLTLGCEQKDP